MPLLENALDLIRANLVTVAGGTKARPVVVGHFTTAQHAEINLVRSEQGLPALESPEIVFLGGHLYKSRVIKDGYTIEDVLLQIQYALADTAEVKANSWMTATKSTVRRRDGYGNEVLDEAVFELTQRKPRAELFSVAPKGDRVKPNEVKSAA